MQERDKRLEFPLTTFSNNEFWVLIIYISFNYYNYNKISHGKILKTTAYGESARWYCVEWAMIIDRSVVGDLVKKNI